MAKVNFKNALAYLQGKYRYQIYYNSRLKWLMRPHIREQIESRIKSMDDVCFFIGQCKLCGCETTALQMADKACDKPCYPSMMTKRNWNYIKRGSALPSERIWWRLINGKFVKDE